MKSLILALCLFSGLATAQNVRLDCTRVPAYTAELERLLERGRADPSIWRMPPADALSTIGSRVVGKGEERADIQREQYRQYVSRIKTIMWTVRERCPGS